MSNSPEPGRNQWPAPWASPSPAGTMTQGQPAHDQGGAPSPLAAPADGPDRAGTGADRTAPIPAGAPAGHAAQPGGSYSAPPAYNPPPPAQPPLFATPYGAPAPQPPHQRDPRERRGPGWIGTVAVGAGAAVLASLLTAGIVENRNDGAPSASSYSSGTGSSTSPNSAPLVNSSATNPNWGAVAAAVQPSVVAVQLSLGNGQGDQGSGIVYDTKGHVLTNNHVVAGASSGQLSVILNDGRTYDASVVGTDPSTDLAVLQIKSPPSDLKPARLGNSDAVKVGDPVMAIGNPLGLSDTVTTGIVSALNRPVTTSQQSQGQDQNPFGLGQSQGQAEAVVTNAIQTDAAINPGNSGGALIDAQGRVIGVTSSIASLGSSSGSGQSGNIGLGFAIPSNEVQDVAKQLVQSGSAKHALLGVKLDSGTVTVDGAKRQAAVIAEVSGGAAEAAGVKVGDSVIALNGSTIDGPDSLVARIRALRPGTKITLTVVRDGKAQDLQVTLGTKSADNG
jgi:putative serine protease PepD